MERKIKFQNLPGHLQDELRDAPITAIENGKVQIEILTEFEERLYQFILDLEPRSMEDNAIIHVTQDLQDVEVVLYPIQQIVSA